VADWEELKRNWTRKRGQRVPNKPKKPLMPKEADLQAEEGWEDEIDAKILEATAANDSQKSRERESSTSGTDDEDEE
jgi:hypothetical protein